MPRERRSLSSQMTLSMGSAIHAIVQTQLKMAGLITQEDIEVPLKHPTLPARGNADWIIRHPNGTRILCDLKTQNPIGFNKETEPKASWVAQLSCYADWAGIDDCVVVVFMSGFPYQMKEFRFRKNQQVLDRTYTKWNLVLDAIQKDDPSGLACCTPAERWEYERCPVKGLREMGLIL